MGCRNRLPKREHNSHGPGSVAITKNPRLERSNSAERSRGRDIPRGMTEQAGSSPAWAEVHYLCRNRDAAGVHTGCWDQVAGFVARSVDAHAARWRTYRWRISVGQVNLDPMDPRVLVSLPVTAERPDAILLLYVL